MREAGKLQHSGASPRHGRRSGAGRSARTNGSHWSATAAAPWRLPPACACLLRRAPRGAARRVRRACQSPVCPTAGAARIAGALCDWRNWYIGVAMLLTQCGNVALMYFLPLMLRNALYGPDAAPDVPPGSFTAGASHAHDLARAPAAYFRVPAISVGADGEQGWRALLCLPSPPGARPVCVCMPRQARPSQPALALMQGVLSRGAPPAADSEGVRSEGVRADAARAAAAGAPGVAHRADHARAVPGDDAGAGHHRLELQARQRAPLAHDRAAGARRRGAHVRPPGALCASGHGAHSMNSPVALP